MTHPYLERKLDTGEETQFLIDNKAKLKEQNAQMKMLHDEAFGKFHWNQFKPSKADYNEELVKSYFSEEDQGKRVKIIASFTMHAPDAKQDRKNKIKSFIAKIAWNKIKTLLKL